MDDIAGGTNALAQFQPAVTWHQRRRPPVAGLKEAARREAHAASDFKGIAKPLRGHQCSTHTLAFEYCIGRNSGAVNYNGELSRINVKRFKACIQAFPLPSRNRRHFGGTHRTGCRIE